MCGNTFQRCRVLERVFSCDAFFLYLFSSWCNFHVADWTNDVVSREYTLQDLSPDSNSSNINRWKCFRVYAERDRMWLGLYGGSVALSFTIMLAGGILMARLRVRVAKALHENMIRKIMRTPISFLMSHLRKNSESILEKEMNPWHYNDDNDCIYNGDNQFCFASFLAIAVATYGLFLILLIPMWIVFYILLGYIRNTSIEVQRLEAIARSQCIQLQQKSWVELKQFALMVKHNVWANIPGTFE